MSMSENSSADSRANVHVSRKPTLNNASCILYHNILVTCDIVNFTSRKK